MSMAMDGRFLRTRWVAAITASASEPTKPAMGGGKYTPASGLMATPSSAARSATGSAMPGANGAAPKPMGDSPSARWCMAVLPTTVMSQIWRGSTAWRSQSAPRVMLTPSTTARCSCSSRPGLTACAMRLMTSSP